MNATAAMVKVSIFGNEYRVRGDAPAAEVQAIAAHVDRVMREIAAGGKHISPTRIAILAAFNIAAELHRATGGRGFADPSAEDRVARMLQLFESEDTALAKDP
jgi:cell division protein ZapA